ncbi:MAG: lipid-A-disaccharide synthase [Paracoccaceae bacterium]
MSFFSVAGEPSGDLLGAALMRGLKDETGGRVKFRGIGGPEMAREGLVSLFDMSELSVMGVAEILPRLPSLLRRISGTAEAVLSDPPDAVITIDSPDFGLRVARKVKAARRDLPVIHYVAPSVWAWRPQRAKKMARCVDHVLALLPFEPPYMTAAGMTCDFVGHPVAARPEVSDYAVAKFFESLGLPRDRKILLLLPGSRKGELRRMGPLHAEVARMMLKREPDLSLVIPGAAPVMAEVRERFDTPELHPIIIDPTRGDPELAEKRKRAAFAAATVAFATSGTVSLELAAAGTPMVIAYKANALTAMLVRKLIRIDTATLVNLVSDTRTVPEFFQEAATAENVVPVLADILRNPDAAAGQLAAAKKTMQLLGRGDIAPGVRAAKSVLAAITR